VEPVEEMINAKKKKEKETLVGNSREHSGDIGADERIIIITCI
jgi:hypothetical protein